MWLFKTGVSVWCASLLAVPILAFAHATPISYTPVAGATELETPSSISIRFTERIEMGASSLTVFGPDGTQQNQGKGTLDEYDERVLSVPVTNGGDGVYTVSWQVVSVDDGHFTKGAFSFLVDPTGKVFEGAKEGVEITYSSKLQDAFLSFLNLLGESIYVGLLAFLLFIFRPLSNKKLLSPQQEGSLLKVAFHLAVIGYLLFVFGSVIAFARKSAELSQLQNTSFIEGALVYLNSSVGTLLALKVVAITVLCISFLLFHKRIFKTSLALFIFWGLLLMAVLSLQAYVSHAAASFFMPKLSIALTFVHLLAKELIIGGAVILCALFVLCARKNTLWMYKASAVYFDMLASLSLFAAGVSGSYITWLHLKHVENIAATEWGDRFVALLIATALFGAFRLFHQFMVNPRLEQARWQKIISWSVFGEGAAALLVLFISGYISMTTPPFTVEEYSFSQRATSEGLVLEIGVHPYEHGSLKLSLKDEVSGEFIEAQKLTVTAQNQQKAIGPNVVETVRRSQGVYVVPLSALSPKGYWDLSVIAAQKSAYDAQASFGILYPEDIEATKLSDDVRTFDTFALYILAIALVMALFSFILYIHARSGVAKLTLQTDALGMFSNETLYTWVARLGVIVMTILLFLMSFTVLGGSSFERICLQDGHVWQQAFPARDFEATSPNAVTGCTVHDGHYHFADETEYKEYKKGQ